jgi:hypothetical protein
MIKGQIRNIRARGPFLRPGDKDDWPQSDTQPRYPGNPALSPNLRFDKSLTI